MVVLSVKAISVDRRRDSRPPLEAPRPPVFFMGEPIADWIGVQSGTVSFDGLTVPASGGRREKSCEVDQIT